MIGIYGVIYWYWGVVSLGFVNCVEYDWGMFVDYFYDVDFIGGWLFDLGLVGVESLECWLGIGGCWNFCLDF